MNRRVQTLIIGAGLVGCSAAHQLAKLGSKDILVIDKGELYENDGSSSHAPGGVNPLSNNASMAQLARHTIDLFATLPPWKPGRKPFHMVGGLDVARTQDRMYEFKRLYSNAKGFGVESHMVSPREIRERFPLMRGEPFLGGLFTPEKPIVAGAHICGSLAAEAAQTGGVTFVSHTKAIDFKVENNRISAVRTNNPDLEWIGCERVLLCTNIWTPALSAKLGITIPLQAAEHQYLKSAPLAELAQFSDHSDPDQEIAYPSVRDLDGGLYYRHWWDSLGIGSYHHRPIMLDAARLGKSADHPFTAEDFVAARQLAEEAIPALAGVEFPYKINGMFSFSVDGLPILGETTVAGFWLAAAVWVTNSGGVGKAMAEWMTYGEPEVDMRGLDVNRFLEYQTTKRYIDITCAKAYEEVHDVIHPAQWPSRPRNIRHTPLFARHQELKAVFTPSAGLEIPYWLEENQRLLEKYDEQIPERTGWGAQYWSRLQGAEHLALRDGVGLMDLTALAIIEIDGPDAGVFCNYVFTNQMDIAVGRVTYTLMCTPKGGIKRDVAVARLAADRYWIFTGSGTLPLELAWLRQHRRDFAVNIVNQGPNYAALGLFGPQSRDLLACVTSADISNKAFPFYTWRAIEVGLTTVYAMRISYVGELGWELHMPPGAALAVRDEIWAAGRDFDLVPVGVGAMRSLRVEKGYRLWGADIYTEHNPFEAGMGWLVKLDKGDFIGREALAQLKATGRSRRLVTLTLDEPGAVVTGNEPIFANGACIGQITSGNYGYSVGKYIAFGYLPLGYAQPGTELEVEYLAERFKATVAPDVLFDPNNERLKA